MNVSKQGIFVIFCLLGLLPDGLGAEVFQFKLERGNLYSIESVNVQDVYWNGAFHQSGRITGKVSVKVEGVDGEWTDNRGDFFFLEEVSMGSEKVFELSEQVTVPFRRDSRGEMEVDEKHRSPAMRSLPWFPGDDLSSGDTWTHTAWEVQDLSRSYHVLEVRYPVDVSYTYLGPEEYDGETYHRIELAYDVFYNNNPEYAAGLFYPARVRGRSERIMLWDGDRGLPFLINEDFYIIFDMANGDEIIYDGNRSAVYTMNEELTDVQAEEVEDAVSKLEDTEVERREEGITITLHNIHFDPDSPVLREEEKKRLREIGEILNYYDDKDLLITGHAADIGDWGKGVELSEERAANTAAFIKGLLDNPDRLIMTMGVGAAEPVDTNDTEAGRARNRRVEITILEN